MRTWLVGLWLSGTLLAGAQAPELSAASYEVTILSVPAGADVVLPPKTPLGRSGSPLTVDFALGQPSVRLELSLPGHQVQYLELDRQQAKNGRPNRPVYLPPDNAWIGLRDFFAEHRWLGGLLAVLGLLGLAAAAVLGPRAQRFYHRGRYLENLKRRARDDREGTRLGPYRLTDQLGSGGMGTVYRAIPEETLDESQAVAVKLLHPQLASAPDSVRRLNREVQVLKELRHPGINQLLGVGEDDGTHYLVLELLQGEPLSAKLKEDGLALDQAWAYLEPLLEAVAYAHGKNGVIHRDLKPENVMVLPDGRLKVLDFGLARAASSEKITITGNEAGTPPYMSLEQLVGQEPDPAMDQYALGVIAYELLTGRRPFEGDSPMEVINARLTREATPLSTYRNLPPALEEAVMRMIAREARDRFPCVRSAAAALRQAFQEASALAGRR